MILVVSQKNFGQDSSTDKCAFYIKISFTMVTEYTNSSLKEKKNLTQTWSVLSVSMFTFIPDKIKAYQELHKISSDQLPLSAYHDCFAYEILFKQYWTIPTHFWNTKNINKLSFPKI